MTCCEVEQTIDVFKTNLDADSTYMPNERSLEAYTFVNFIALQMYYLIREKLRSADKLSKYSPMQMVKYLTSVRGVYVNGKWTRAEITKNKPISLPRSVGTSNRLCKFNESYSLTFFLQWGLSEWVLK